MCCTVVSCSVISDSETPWTNPPGSSIHGDSPGKKTGVGCHHALLQGIFPTQASNPGLPHCRWIFTVISVVKKKKKKKEKFLYLAATREKILQRNYRAQQEDWKWLFTEVALVIPEKLKKWRPVMD